RRRLLGLCGTGVHPRVVAVGHLYRHLGELVEERSFLLLAQAAAHRLIDLVRELGERHPIRGGGQEVDRKQAARNQPPAANFSTSFLHLGPNAAIISCSVMRSPCAIGSSSPPPSRARFAL